MAIRIQLRRDTSANWASANPVLRAGEIGIETDTLKFKVGNGSTAWNSITAYANVVPTDLNNTLDGYLEVGDLSDTVAELVNGDLYIPGTDIIFEGGSEDAFELYLKAPDVTVSDKTVTLPNATTTLVGRDTTDTLTNKTLTSPVVSGLTLSDASIVFEGAVADSYETTLTAGEPTNDRTITLPNSSGTVALTSDIPARLTITQVNTGGTATETYTDISTLAFDEDSGFDVTNPSAGVAKVAMNSTFKNWNVNGEAGLVAQGLDTVNIISSGAITVAANNTSNPKTLTIGTTGLDEISVDAVAAALAAGTHTNITVSYNDNANSISLTGAVTYTDENAQDAVGNAVGNGLDYDDNTGAISVDPSEFALSAVGAPTSDVGMASYKITNLAAPTSANDAATKAYVDNTTAGLNFHAAVHAATTADLNASYNNGTSGVGATLTSNPAGTLVVDGHTLSVGERVLVKNQTAALQNGIYVVTDAGSESGPWILTRATDADNSPTGELAYGDFTFVQQGSTNAGFGYIVNTTGTITIGTTAISYVQFNAGQVVVAGNGLTETTPGTLAINTGVTADLSTAQTFTNKTISGANNTLTVRLANDVTGTLPVANGGTGLTSLGSGISTFLGTPSSANLAATVTDETGSGSLVFATSPTLTTPNLGTPSALTLTNATGLPVSGITASTSAALGVGSIELGHASDTTLSRAAAGRLAVEGVNVVTISSTDTLTNKTLTSPIISTISNTGTLTLPTSTDTLVGRATTDTLTNKTVALGSNTVSGTISQFNTALTDADFATLAGTETLTNKVIGTTSTTTVNANTATTIDTTALNSFTTIRYIVSIKQSGKIRSSQLMVQTDGTNVDYAEYGVVETGGQMNGILVEAVASGSNCLLRVTITNAGSVNATVKIQEVLI